MYKMLQLAPYLMYNICMYVMYGIPYTVTVKCYYGTLTFCTLHIHCMGTYVCGSVVKTACTPAINKSSAWPSLYMCNSIHGLSLLY